MRYLAWLAIAAGILAAWTLLGAYIGRRRRDHTARLLIEQMLTRETEGTTELRLRGVVRMTPDAARSDVGPSSSRAGVPTMHKRIPHPTPQPPSRPIQRPWARRLELALQDAALICAIIAGVGGLGALIDWLIAAVR